MDILNFAWNVVDETVRLGLPVKVVYMKKLPVGPLDHLQCQETAQLQTPYKVSPCKCS